MKKVKFVVVISIISIFIIFNKGATVYGQQNNKAQAVSLFKQGYYSGAASLLKPLNQQFPKDAEINFYYGASLVNMQTNLEKAVIILADVSFSNDWPAAKFYLAKAYHLQYKFTEAKKYYRRFIDYSDKKTLENYNAQIQLEACDIAIRLIASATQIESRNIEQKSLLEIEDFLLQNNSGSWQIINNELKSKIDKKLPHGFSIIQSSLKEEVYYASYRKKGKMRLELVYNFKNKNGKWNKAKLLSEILSGEYDEINPVISANGKALFFCSNGKGTMGGYDIFKSSFDSEIQEWTEPVNLGYPINTPFDDFLFIPDIENNTAVIASNRECRSDSVWLIDLDLNAIENAGEISDYSEFSLLFSINEDIDYEVENKLFRFPVPCQSSKSLFSKLVLEAETDENLLKNYLAYVDKEIELLNSIGDFKEKSSLKKKKEAQALKKTSENLAHSSAKAKVEENYKTLIETAEINNSEAEFSFSYMHFLKKYQRKIEELLRQSSDFKNRLNADDEVYAQWQKLKTQRNQFNQYSNIFIQTDIEIGLKIEELEKKKEELLISETGHVSLKEIIKNNERELAIKQREAAELSGANMNQLLSDIKLLKEKNNQDKIKLQFLEAYLKNAEKENTELQTYIENLKILNKELITFRGQSFDFSKYYKLDETIAGTENSQLEKEQNFSEKEADPIYDFSDISEVKILNELTLSKKEQRVFGKAFSFEKKARKIEEKIKKTRTSYRDFEEISQSAEKRKRKKIRKKQKRLNIKIRKNQIDAYEKRIKSFELKKQVITGKLLELKTANITDVEIANRKELKSNEQWQQGMMKWERATKKKSKRIETYSNAFKLIDSSYVNLLHCMAFYIDILPEPSYPKIENEEQKDTVEIEEKITVDETIEEIAKPDYWFSVQVGAYKTKELPLRLQNIPDLYTTQAPNGLYRFSSGKFNSEDEANVHKIKMKDLGISDAFLVGFLKGNRISLSKTREMSSGGNYEYEEQDKALKMQELPGTSKSFYAVQLGVFRGKPDFSKLPKQSIIFSKKFSPGLTKYTYGEFANYSHALEAQQIIRQSGIKDAYVVKVKSGTIKPASYKTGNVQVLNTEIDPSIKNIQQYKGLFYTVQIGVFKQQQSAGSFKGIKPLYYNSESGYFKYFAGLYSSLENAEKVKQEIQQTGISDAFVVAFNNGRKISLTKAKSSFSDGITQTEPEQKVNITKNYSSTEKADIAKHISQKKENRGELFYTIQIGIFGSKLQNLSGIKVHPLYQYQVGNNKTRLTCGSYSSYDSAHRGKEKVIQAGYSDAYIIVFFDGKNISLSEASSLLEKKENIIFVEEKEVKIRTEMSPPLKRSDDDEIEYRVQIASLREPAPLNVVASYIEIAGSYGLNDFLDDNGMTVYTIGKFKTYSEAMKARKYLINNDAKSAFIVAFQGYKKIPLNEAARMTEQD